MLMDGAGAALDRETRLRFIRIDDDTRNLLREFWKTLEPALPGVMDRFYQHVTHEPNLTKLIGDKMLRLKKAQQGHWERLFDGRFDDGYMQGVHTIGMIHNKIGLEPRWYIGGYAFVLNRLTELAVKSYRRQADKLAKL